MDRSCTIGNLSYYYDKDITFENCTFMSGNRNIYVVTDCTCNVNNCNFINSKVCIYNEGDLVNINNSNFTNITTIISNGNNTTDNIVNINNSNSSSPNASSSSNVISATNNTHTINNINNCYFKGSNRLGSGIFNIKNCNLEFSATNNLTMEAGSRIYNSFITKDIAGRDDNKVFNTYEECKEHEKSIKDKEKEALREKKEKEFDVLKKRYDSINDLIDKWIDDYYAYKERYENIITKDDEKKARESIDLNSFLDFLRFLTDEVNR